MCDLLLKWLSRTFDLRAPHSSVQDISDGVALAEALAQIAPENFTPAWQGKIKLDVGNNWRLKVSNLKKIVEAVMEYYAECLNQQLSGYIKPDAVKIGELCDERELRRLLQLILGCAVNCDRKQHYITCIMEMEETVQQAIMQSIQELEGSMHGPKLSLGALSIDVEDGPRDRLIGELQMAIDSRDQLAQRCHELDQQLSLLQEEKGALFGENKRLQKRLDEFENPDDSGCSLKYSGLRKQVEDLKDELFKMETARDDQRLKVELLEKEILELQSRQEDLQRSAEKAQQLKDEVDALRETADKVSKYEQTLSSYKKKLEDMSDLKRQVKLLEDKNLEYLRYKLESEEDTKKFAMLRSHLEACKLQLAELHRTLDEQTNKSDKLGFENKKLSANLGAVQREKERLVVERDALKETNEELKCTQLNMIEPANDALGDAEMLPPGVREKLLFLQHENKMLKLNQPGDDDKLPRIEALLEDSEERVNALRSQNRGANQRILELENRLEDAEKPELEHELSRLREKLREEQAEKERLVLRVEEHVSSSQGSARKVQHLQENLARKELEIAALDERYKKYVEKAKSVIKVLDPKRSSASPTEVGILRNQVLEKRRIIEEMERNSKESKLLREMEEKLMISAFYRLSATCHREAVDQRLAALSAGQGQSFLSRQRQPSSRRTYNSK